VTLSLLLLVIAVVLLAIAAFTAWRPQPWSPSVGWAGLFFWALSVLLGGVHIS
jgi:hypothetical protein